MDPLSNMESDQPDATVTGVPPPTATFFTRPVQLPPRYARAHAPAGPTTRVCRNGPRSLRREPPGPAVARAPVPRIAVLPSIALYSRAHRPHRARDGPRAAAAAGKYELASPCKGPARCDVTSGRVVCDDRLADLGDRCVMLPGDANYACSPDGKVMGVCQEPGQIHLWTHCRGQKGCVTVRFSARCDESISREGERCMTATDVACSEDGRSQLTCADNHVWGKAQDCKRGCVIAQGAGDEPDSLSCD